MNGKVPGKLLLLAGILFSASAMASPSQVEDIASLINQRLSWMKDVAGYKAKNHLAIEDLTQEAKVLSSSVSEAEKLGLNGESVKPFIQAQMDAAKAIQYRYRADWLSVEEQGWQPAPLEQVRGKISALNTKILSEVKERLTAAPWVIDRPTFMATLDQANLSAADKARLIASLQQITLKK